MDTGKRIRCSVVEIVYGPCHQREQCYRYQSAEVALCLEQVEEGVDTHGNAEQCPYIESYACPSTGFGRCACLGKFGESGSVLVEYHPEEYNYGKHEKQGDNALAGLCRSEFRTGRYCGFGCAVFLVVKYVGVCLASERIYKEAGNKRHASHCKAIAVAGGQGGYVL